MLQVLFYVLAICYYSQGVELPGYLYYNRCSRSSPTINECVVKSANKVIPRFVEGIDSLNIPNMLPLKLDVVSIREDDCVRFNLKHVKVYGLENTKLTYSKLGFNEKIFTCTIVNPKILILGDYEMKGYIVGVPVHGHGKVYVSIVNGEYPFELKFDVDDNLFAKNFSIQQSYKTEYNTYYFTGLTVGNENKEYPTNAFMNYHWKEVSRLLKPGTSIVMGNFIRSIFQNINDVLPLTETFLP